LKFLHSLFKSEEAHEFLALGYITGILPIKKQRIYLTMKSRKRISQHWLKENEISKSITISNPRNMSVLLRE
jgi:hypothetical protein